MCVNPGIGGPGGHIQVSDMKLKKSIASLALAGAMLLTPLSASAGLTQTGLAKLQEEIRHDLVMLPWYGVFDDLKFQVADGGRHVILSGQVTRPTLRSDAQRVVERIEGVEKVTNNIEVLPLSWFDDRIRVAVARSIFGYGPMYRYAMGAVPSIHIIVKNGHVRLTGVVANEGDKTLARIRANGVGGVFSVTDDLRTESAS